ncbi:MAG: hypothetical protein Q9159_000476 [Coniocarpon cinnabarinum]
MNGALNGTYASKGGDSEVAFDSIPDCIEAFRQGEFLVVLDSPDRENEGDLIISGAAITPETCAFMIKHTSGYLCAPLTQQHAENLRLRWMVPADESEDPNGTAYCVSVDAAKVWGTTTGISAVERAASANVLAGYRPRTSLSESSERIPEGASEQDLRRPGHLLPLIAREGGVRTRRGHTEAGVEFARLAGNDPPVAVIGELVEEAETESIPNIDGAAPEIADPIRSYLRIWPTLLFTNSSTIPSEHDAPSAIERCKIMLSDRRDSLRSPPAKTAVRELAGVQFGFVFGAQAPNSSADPAGESHARKEDDDNARPPKRQRLDPITEPVTRDHEKELQGQPAQTRASRAKRTRNDVSSSAKQSEKVVRLSCSPVEDEPPCNRVDKASLCPDSPKESVAAPKRAMKKRRAHKATKDDVDVSAGLPKLDSGNAAMGAVEEHMSLEETHEDAPADPDLALNTSDTHEPLREALPSPKRKGRKAKQAVQYRSPSPQAPTAGPSRRGKPNGDLSEKQEEPPQISVSTQPARGRPKRAQKKQPSYAEDVEALNSAKPGRRLRVRAPKREPKPQGEDVHEDDARHAGDARCGRDQGIAQATVGTEASSEPQLEITKPPARRGRPRKNTPCQNVASDAEDKKKSNRELTAQATADTAAKIRKTTRRKAAKEETEDATITSDAETQKTPQAKEVDRPPGRKRKVAMKAAEKTLKQAVQAELEANAPVGEAPDNGVKKSQDSSEPKFVCHEKNEDTTGARSMDDQNMQSATESQLSTKVFTATVERQKARTKKGADQPPRIRKTQAAAKPCIPAETYATTVQEQESRSKRHVDLPIEIEPSSLNERSHKSQKTQAIAEPSISAEAFGATVDEHASNAKKQVLQPAESAPLSPNDRTRKTRKTQAAQEPSMPTRTSIKTVEKHKSQPETRADAPSKIRRALTERSHNVRPASNRLFRPTQLDDEDHDESGLGNIVNAFGGVKVPDSLLVKGKDSRLKFKM